MADLLVRATALDKIYGEGEAATHALRGVTFDFEEGEFASIVGQSGSGKSTLLNLLGILDTPTSGTVTYRGQDISALPKPKRAKLRGELVGFVFQFHYLLPEFSVFENVAMPSFITGRLTQEEIRRRAFETLGLLGLEGLESKNANQLSGGQKQRVAIARALMNRPALVLADEPTGNLDTVNTNLVYDLFRKINAETGTAFLIVTHDRGVAQRTDRILEVTDGELVQDMRNGYGPAAR
ncbi:MAG TPA: ABC transporter ATP-binding protein [Coriobacteriia bacterium]|nr:ABC transporter ATP-binding protein [Coriobacteriia bacterium]